MFGRTPPPRRFPACLVALLLAPLLCAPAARAADDDGEAKPTLKVGDPAPKLFVSKWVKGEPVKEFEKGKVYVVECWATWCGPCRTAIPHVTELQQKYKDKGVTIIGMNVWERDAAAPEPFVKEMGDKMGYTVALDEIPEGQREGKTATAWLKAAGKNGIPCSFIVDKESKLAWVGHPMSMDRPLAKIVDGTYDVKKEAELLEKTKQLQQKFSQAMQAEEHDKAIGLLDELAAADPDMADQAQMMKLSVLVQKKDYDAVNAAAKKLAEGAFKDKPKMQGELALNLLLRSPEPEKVDADLAVKMAERALAAAPDELRFQKAAAMAYAAKKQYAKAAEVQGKLVESLKGRAPQEVELLEEYKSKAAGGAKSGEKSEK